VVVPTPRGIPRPKPISRITESNSNRNSMISNDSFTDEELVEAQFKARAHSIEDSEEFQRAVDSFEEIFRSESGSVDIMGHKTPPSSSVSPADKRRSVKKAKRTETKELMVGVVNGKLTETRVGSVTLVEEFSSNDVAEMPDDFPTDQVPLDAEAVKNVDGASKQRKGSSRFMRRQNSSRSNRSSIGSQEEQSLLSSGTGINEADVGGFGSGGVGGGSAAAGVDDVNMMVETVYHSSTTVVEESLPTISVIGQPMSHSIDRTSPDLTSRLVETNDQMQRLDETFRNLCEEQQGGDGGNKQHHTRRPTEKEDESVVRRGHSLTRTKVNVAEDPLDQMIEAIIQPSSNNPQE